MPSLLIRPGAWRMRPDLAVLGQQRRRAPLASACHLAAAAARRPARDRAAAAAVAGSAAAPAAAAAARAPRPPRSARHSTAARAIAAARKVSSWPPAGSGSAGMPPIRRAVWRAPGRCTRSPRAARPRRRAPPARRSPRGRRARPARYRSSGAAFGSILARLDRGHPRLRRRLCDRRLAPASPSSCPLGAGAVRGSSGSLSSKADSARRIVSGASNSEPGRGSSSGAGRGGSLLLGRRPRRGVGSHHPARWGRLLASCHAWFRGTRRRRRVRRGPVARGSRGLFPFGGRHRRLGNARRRTARGFLGLPGHGQILGLRAGRARAGAQLGRCSGIAWLLPVEGGATLRLDRRRRFGGRDVRICVCAPVLGRSCRLGAGLGGTVLGRIPRRLGDLDAAPPLLLIGGQREAEPDQAGDQPQREQAAQKSRWSAVVSRAGHDREQTINLSRTK